MTNGRLTILCSAWGPCWMHSQFWWRWWQWRQVTILRRVISTVTMSQPKDWNCLITNLWSRKTSLKIRHSWRRSWLGAVLMTICQTWEEMTKPEKGRWPLRKKRKRPHPIIINKVQDGEKSAHNQILTYFCILKQYLTFSSNSPSPSSHW